MTIIKAAFQNIATTPVDSTWNAFTAPTTSGSPLTLSSDLLDVAGASTGVTLTNLLDWAGGSASGTLAGTTDYFGWQWEAWIRNWYVGVAGDGDMLQLSGLNAGDNYTLKIAGAVGNVTRPTTFNATGSTGAQLYTPTASEPPTEQVTVSGTIPAGGIVDISVVGSSVFAYITGFEFEYTASGLTITTEPSTVARGETGVVIGASAGGFGAVIGTSTLEYGSDADGWIDISASVTAWSDTSITFDMPSNIALQHDATGYKFKVTVN